MAGSVIRIQGPRRRPAAALILCGGVFFGIRVSATVEWQAQRLVIVDGAPSLLRVADVDGDGVPDLVVASDLDVVTGFRGDGEGRFEPLFTFATGPGARDAVVADWNEDGRPDIAVAHLGAAFPASPGVTLLSSRLAGGYEAPVELEAGDEPRALAAADFDGDGHVDLAIATRFDEQGTVWTRLGDGAGDFGAPLVAYVGTLPSALAAVHLDADGTLDLAMADEGSSRVALLAGDGLGGFSVFTNLVAPGTTTEIAAADFNEDGRTDLAAFVDSRFQIAVFLSAAGGSWARQDRPGGRSIDVADVNADGHEDIVLSESPALLGDGAGGFLPGGDSPNGSGDIAARDLDRDGFVDLAWVRTFGVSAAIADSPGRFPDGFCPSLPESLPAAAAAGDFDEDGHLDVADARPGRVRLLFGDGTGRYGSESIFPDGDQDEPRDVAAADFDEDGHLDVAKLIGLGGAKLLRGDGRGSLFLYGQAIVPGSTNHATIDAIDLDRDGHVDLVSSPGAGIHVAFGDGRGFFPSGLMLPATLGNAAHSLAVADFDRDGRLDLAAPNLVADTVSVFFGFSARAFAVQRDVTTFGAEPNAVAAGDMDIDGDVDLVAAGTRLSILPGDGRGGFGPSVSFPIPLGSRGPVLAADLDEDGRPEVTCATAFGVVSYAPDGSGGVVPTRTAFFTAGTRALGDIDEDGHLDFVLPRACLVFNRSSRLADARRGNVNARAGAIADVLFVNGSPGSGSDRTVRLGPADPIEVRMGAPPSRPGIASRFVLYAWLHPPRPATVEVLPQGVGLIAHATFLSSGAPRPSQVWNNIGREDRLGAPTLPSQPAPSLVFRRAAGIGRRAAIHLQGLVRDGRSPSGRYAVTNGVTIDTR